MQIYGCLYVSRANSQMLLCLSDRKSRADIGKMDLAIVHWPLGEGSGIEEAIQSALKDVNITGVGTIPVQVFIDKNRENEIRQMPWPIWVRVGPNERNTEFYLRQCN